MRKSYAQLRSEHTILFGIEKICSDAQMRRVLDEVSPDQLQELFPKSFDLFQRFSLMSS